MNIEQQRTAFEAWFKSGSKRELERAGYSYVLMSASSAWLAWQASVYAQPVSTGLTDEQIIALCADAGIDYSEPTKDFPGLFGIARMDEMRELLSAAQRDSKQASPAEDYLRGRYGAHRGHFAWRELEEAFNAGKASVGQSTCTETDENCTRFSDVSKNGGNLDTSADARDAALLRLRQWFETQRKAISKGCGSSWDMGQCDDQMDLIDAAIAASREAQ